jgi:hypothetical protein
VVAAADVPRRLERRVRREREHRAVARVERDDRAAVRGPLVVGVREVDAVLQRALRGPLQVGVEREPQVVPGRGADGRLDRRLRAAAAVDRQLRRAVTAAQVAVVGRLDAGLPDDVAGLVAELAPLLQLVLRDLADVPERLRGERAVRVLAQVAVRQAHAGELVLPLPDVRVLVRMDAVLDHDGRERVVLVLLHAREDLAHRDVDDLRELPQLRALGRPALREVGGPQLDARAERVDDERLAVPVEDRAARRVERADAHAVVVCGGRVLRPGEDLERPQAQEQHREHAERERAEDRDAERELRGQPVRLADAGIRRQERARRAASQGGAPRGSGRRCRPAGAACARARRPGRSAAG